jgi:nucleoid DNA-binding protein
MVAKNPPSLKPIKEKQTKAQIVVLIAEETGLTRAQVVSVIDTLADVAKRHLAKKGSGEFAVPSLGVKLRRAKKPAQKARKGRNPFTGAEITIAARPARDVVKATPLKALKDII